MKKKNKRYLSMFMIVLLLFSNLHTLAMAEDTRDELQNEDSIMTVSGDWSGSVMGDIGTDDITIDNFEITENSDNSVTLRASNNRGKIASSAEGLVYYFQEIDPNANFEFSAKAHIDSWDANNQVSFGIMLRSNILENERDNHFTGDYLATGAIRQEMRSFYKYENDTLQTPDELTFTANTPAPDEPYDLHLRKDGHVYQLTIGDETKVIDDFNAETPYIGLFAARNTTITYSDINLTIDGHVDVSDWFFTAFGGNTSITSDPIRNPDPIYHEDGSISLEALGGKIASGDEGISFYTKQLPSEANFTIRARAYVQSFHANGGISTPNQKSFGLMLRDDIGEHGDSSVQTANYVAVGAVDQVMKPFYKEGASQIKGDTFATNAIPTSDEVYDLSIRKSGDTYVLTSNDETETFSINDLFTNELFAGFYVARDAYVTFSDFTIEVESNTVSELLIDSESMKTEYLVGEELDLSGLNVTAVYSDGSTAILTEADYIVTGFDSSTVGTNTISLHFGGATAHVELTIGELTVTNVDIKYEPATLTYFLGDTFDPHGLVVIAEFNDGFSYSELSLDDYQVMIDETIVDEHFTFQHSGTKEVVIRSTTSPSVTTTFMITVANTTISHLEIRQPPEKEQYFIGDSLDLSGLILYAVYDDGSDVRLTRSEYTTTSLDTASTGEKEITLSHKGIDIALMLHVKEREAIGLKVAHYPKTTYSLNEEFDATGLNVELMFDNGDREPYEHYTIEDTNFNRSTAGVYDIIIQPTEADIESISFPVTVREPTDYEFDFIMFGQSVSESRNDWRITEEGTVLLEAHAHANAGKITGDHDGVVYYYTELDANKDNFVLSADIQVHHYAKTPHDGQESFGIMARDAIGTHGDSGVFSSNIAAIGGFAGGTRDDNGTQLFARTGVLSPDGEGSKGIEKIMLDPRRPSSENTYPNEPYRLTLAKTNSGFIGQINDGEETILFEPEIMNVQGSNMYVGFYVAREATIEVHNIDLQVTAAATDAPKVEPPAQAITPTIDVLSLDRTSDIHYELKTRANVAGVVTIRQGTNHIAVNQFVEGGNTVTIPTTLTEQADTPFSISFLPDDTQYLTSYDRIVTNYSVTHRSFVEDGDIYVSPDGAPTNTGLADNPLDIDTAIDYVRPGQKIIVLDGHYVRDKPLHIRKYNNGTKDNMKYLVAAPDARPIFDFDRRSHGMLHEGDYWHVEGLDFTRSAGNTKGYHIGGHHNIIENARFYDNGDSGLQISRLDGTLTDITDWPSHNLILNSVSFDNRDPAENNADGFAVKLTSGEGNILRGVIAHNNIDDGFDLYAKVGTGPIGAVVIEDSLAFNNGFLTDGTEGGGDKNGFKLGGEGIHVPHIIRNSIAWGNGKVGFTSNSNPGVIAYDNISFNNAERNSDFTTYSNITSDFTIDGFVSFHTEEHSSSDRYPSSANSHRNFMYDGKQSKNEQGDELPEELTSILQTIVSFERDGNGEIQWGDIWDTYYAFMASLEAKEPDEEDPIPDDEGETPSPNPKEPEPTPPNGQKLDEDNGTMSPPKNGGLTPPSIEETDPNGHEGKLDAGRRGDETTDEQLPSTATPLYNVLFYGIILMFVGLLVLALRRRIRIY
ncbi:bacterial Ig-like domain-containing protein [Halalkalibacter sp. APA_J-10(15)]|uniref:bacterial Ig-like domain-containing protein n=1 Tax=Halalkalibacter sp. APA_J-10(15) TaxID=2933805 RepID=UPI001FF16085|nr:bacterial Ig-like domain-containing protein [Halalkalibacter sp. APA_J-10(15)]MCK0472321.1 bacterial Ig-like domain-containing protein [Halalkalibacter sp. APA_J-10(15)]